MLGVCVTVLSIGKLAPPGTLHWLFDKLLGLEEACASLPSSPSGGCDSAFKSSASSPAIHSKMVVTSACT